jgi:acyl-coenzyme A synthetase/AMP-(fatty) acid ligase
MSLRSRSSLWDAVRQAGFDGDPRLWASADSIAVSNLASGSALAVPLEDLRDRTALVWTSDPLTAAVTLLEIDGVVRRLVLCPPDLDATHLPYIVETAEVDVIISDGEHEAVRVLPVDRIVRCERSIRRVAVDRTAAHETEWILFTSGTTGVPKMVVHTLATLTGAIEPMGSLAGRVVWATFYDIRRYGGLQILLRTLIGGGSLVLSTAGEDSAAFLARAGEHGVTHITGTPSHWRRALMSGAGRSVSPTYVRLSGEIADQGVIDQLRAAFSRSRVGHAFASTEAGVAFEVTDGLAGFPTSFLGRGDGGVDLEIEGDTLRVRSPRTARRYLGDSGSLLDARGFVDTGDVIDQRGDRCYFVGRRGGIINVGGLKVHPEEVEAVINRHPRVRMSMVSGRKNPITGAIVSADVVMASAADRSLDADLVERSKAEILDSCRQSLPVHKIPALIRVVDSLAVTASGKMGRRDA